MQQNITCPSCGKAVPLDQALTLEIKKELEGQMAEEFSAKQKEIDLKKNSLEELKIKLEEDRKAMDEMVKVKLEDEKKKMWVLAQEKAGEKIDLQMKDLQNQLQEQQKKLDEGREKELELLKKERELIESKKNLELEMEKKFSEQAKVFEEQARLSASEEFGKRLKEKDHQMDQMRKTIEDLRRKSEQGSMQIQGDVAEEGIKVLLQGAFPMDLIADVPTGIRGGDLIQTVKNAFGQDVGVILWESKNAKNWTDDWVKKLKQDQGLAKADICVLVTKVLPEGFENFGYRDGVWICAPTFVLSLVNALRFHLKEIGQVKNSLVGRDAKMEQLYGYLSGNQFRNRVENIVVAFRSMKEDLETEKRSMNRIWARREKELERVIFNTSSMYGDLEGIIGQDLPHVEYLELPGKEDPLEIEE